MRNNLYRFNRENHLEIPLDTHTGINTGMVIAGAIGTDGKRDYSIMGDAVTLAAQLKDLSGKGEIYVGPLTYRYTKKKFDYKELKPVFLEGKTKPTGIFELLSTRERIYRPELGSEWIYSDMVGREKELDRLRFHVLKVIHGEGSIVSVIGEAGIGKSRLIAELKRMEDFKKVMLFEGRALSIGKNLSYHPIIESLKSWVSIKEEDSKAELLSRLDAAIANIHPRGVEEVLPFIATLMGIKLKGKHAQRVKGIEGEAMEKLILKNLGELMIKCAERRPLVYIVEDLHWADMSSIELLESLFRLAENQPILFIDVLRPNYRETGERLLETTRERYGKVHSEIYLEPLDEKQCEILIQNLVKVSGLPTDIRADIANRAEGNPFFIEEVVRSFFDEGVVELREGNPRITEKIDAVKIPETIHDVLMARIDRLDETNRTLLKKAAVIGRHFFYKVLTEIDKTTENIEDKLEYLKVIQLIRERMRLEEIEYLFKHALVQEVAYESILLKKRKELHLNVAKAIESVFSDRLYEFYGMLALHYSKGENLEKAEEYLIKAGEEALKAAASNEALSYYREALRLYLKKTVSAVDPGKIAMLEKNIAIALFNKGHYAEAVEHFDNVFAYWGKKRPKNKFIVLLKLAVNLLGLIKNLYFPAKKPKKIPGKKDNEIINLGEKKAGALSALDSTRFFVESIESLNRLIKLDISKMENGVAIFTAGSALFSYTGISFNISRKILDYIKDYIDKKDIKYFLIYNHVELLHNFYTGSWPPEFQYDEKLIDRGLQVGESFYTDVYTLVSGLLKIEQGDFKCAHRLVEKLCEIGEIYRRELVTGRKYTLNTKLLLKSRKLNEALKEADEGISLLTKIGQNVYCLGVSGMKANIQILLKDIKGAKNSLVQAKALIDYEKKIVPSYRSSLLISQFLFDLYMLEENLSTNDKTKIIRFRKKARRSGKAAVKNSMKFAGDRTEAFKLTGVYYWLIGNQKKALEWWNKSLTVGEQLGARPELARTYMEVGKRLREQKSKHEQLNGIPAGEYLEKARVLFKEMELEWDLDQLDRITK
jgi:tetratricopeptide (TPR) repeat protein/pterin-4a-carbinolamine dehydratase